MYFLSLCLLAVAIVSFGAGNADESEEAGVEVPEAVTVGIEEIHPLPEVSAVTTNTIIIINDRPVVSNISEYIT